jgi:hypothetical protein
MMNTQETRHSAAPARRRLQTLRDGGVLGLGSGGGQLEVLHGRVWLTRAGDRDDHIVAAGETITIPASGDAVVEAWDEARPALVAWQPTPMVERLCAGARSALGPCWDIVDPLRRIGAGAAAAAVALLAGVLLFGPLSASRTRSLLEPTLLHNSAGARTSIGLIDAGPRTGPSHDVSAGARERARFPAPEAGRRPAGPA